MVQTGAGNVVHDVSDRKVASLICFMVLKLFILFYCAGKRNLK
jgi:hypothetical protein